MKQSMVLGCIAIVFLIGWIVLAYLSGKEELYTKETGIRGMVMRIGYYLARVGTQKNLIRPHVKGKLKVLYPTRDIRQSVISYYGEKLAVLTVFLTVGTIFVWLISYIREQDSILQDQKILMRGGYEEEDEEVSLVITEEETGISRVYEHMLLGRTYAEDALDRMAGKLEKELPTLILSDNPDPGHIRSALSLPEKIQDYPFALDWESSDYSVVDSDGSVFNEALSEPYKLTLTAELSYRSFEREITIPLTVYPALLSREESFDREVKKQLDLADQSQQQDQSFILPETLQGRNVSYGLKGEGQVWLLLPLLFVTAMLIYVGRDRDLDQALVRRRKRIENAYPSFVGKFVLLYGAGMSIRRILERLGGDDLQPELLEQLQILNRDLHNGILEQEALDAFGKRTGSGAYIKFAGLLISNLKKGNTEFTEQMKQEADAAFLMRRTLARKLGEEASTKLCFPMILMLGVVMAVIMMPAFLSF